MPSTRHRHTRRQATLGAVVMVAYCVAAALPCPPTVPPASVAWAARSEATAAHHGAHHHGEAHHDQAHHGGHEHAAHRGDATTAEDADAAEAHDADGHCQPPPSWVPRCPCGCDERGSVRVVGGALDPGIPFGAPEAALPAGPAHNPDRAPTLVGAPPRALDKVPISLC